MLYKTKVFVRVIILLYPKPSQLLLSGLLQVTKKVKMSKRTSRTKEFGIIMRIWSFGLDFVFTLLHEKFLQFDWLRAVVFQLNLKYLHVKIINLLRVVV